VKNLVVLSFKLKRIRKDESTVIFQINNVFKQQEIGRENYF
jgi:hypothetical protein